ncbi:MAG: hypothetical protein KIT09_28350 [Bryobacteraceae bacterium]|nr:hypothetical protein [Bryobacteraceae bacterium]
MKMNATRREFLRAASIPAAAGLAGLPASASSTGAARPRLSLNGTWEFRMDPENEGVRRRWFAEDASYPDAIEVPGCWQAQGFGPPDRYLRHNYQGKAWYRRIARIPPEWAGRRLWIHIGGAANSAHVFVNNRLAGYVEGFLTPYEFDVTEALTTGADNVIACRVDSAGPAPVGMFNFVARWGGLYREAYLEARSDPRIDDLFVMPDVRGKRARIRTTLHRNAPEPGWTGRLSVRIREPGGKQFATGEGTVEIAAGETGSAVAAIDVALPDCRTWSPEDPFLYTIETDLISNARAIDRVEDRFGMREFEATPDGRLLLNGRPYFVRGIGDDSVEVTTGVLRPDKQVSIERFRLAKRYGFNAARYLGHTPSKEVFQAADETGFLIMAEGEVYQKIPEAIPLLKNQVSRIAKAYRNHPSWYIWSSGNEFFECQGETPDPIWMDYIQYAHDAFRKVDPTRFFVASDGADVFPTDIITQRRAFEIDDARYRSRPHIWHEFPNTYRGPLPDLTIDKKWSGVYQDDNCISAYRRQVAELGLTRRYPEIRRRSLELFHLYLKNEFESARARKTMDGYAYWCFTDFPAGPEGDMTCYGMFSTVYEPEKFPDPAPILRFNRETVLSIDAGPIGRALSSDQPEDVALIVSHFGEAPIQGGRLAWQVAAGQDQLLGGVVEDLRVAIGEVKQIAALRLGPFNLAEPGRIELRARLESSVCVQDNAWDFWVFPAGGLRPDARGVASLLADPTVARRYGLDSGLSLGEARAVIADRMTPSVLDYIAGGGLVVLLAGAGALQRTQPIAFWPPWIRSSGTWIEDHPLISGFPHDGFCAYQFARLFGEGTDAEGIPAVDLTARDSLERIKLPAIIWGLSTGPQPGASPGDWWKPESRWKLYRHGILCEGRIGQGRILTTALRLASGVLHGYPEAEYLLDGILRHVLSDRFQPEAPPMTVAEARRVFAVRAG